MTTAAEPSAPAATVPSHSAYAVRTANLQADRVALLGLWRDHMQSPPEDKYAWFYLAHPIQPSTVLLLTHGPHADPVGIAGLGTRSVCVQGVRRTAGMLGDLVVRREHRTLFPALLLQKQMRKTALALHSVVYGLPNKNSLPVVRRLGYAPVGELVRYSRVLRHHIYLERRLPRWLSGFLGVVADRVLPFFFTPDRWPLKQWKGSWVDTFDARFDALWARASAWGGVIGVRDARFLAWRFSAQPGHQYRIFAVLAPGGTALTGYAVCEAAGSTLHLRDLLVDPAHEHHAQRLIHLLARAAYQQGFFNLSLEFLGPPAWRDKLIAAGMRARSTRTLYASFGPQDEAQMRTLDWYLTSADEDQ